MSSTKLSTVAAGCLTLATAFSGAVLTTATASADDSTVTTTTISIPVFCSLEATLDTPHTGDVPSGIYSGSNGYYPNGIGQTTLKAYCNDNEGFSIYAVGYTGEVIGNTYLRDNSLDVSTNIVTGTATSGDTSNWAMKLGAINGTYKPIIVGTTEDTEKEVSTPDFSNYTSIPASYTRVAYRNSATDVGNNADGSGVTTTYAAYISRTQSAGSYVGKVKYTMVHPASEEPLQPQPSTAGYINYYANASTAEGTMGRQEATDGNTVKLFASNFSRDGYGFAGWSDAYDYATNANAHFYGPNEDITVPTGTTANGLSLYAVWVKSAGSMQSDANSVCNGLTAATYSDEGDADEATWSINATLSSISALTDTRDGQTYAIAKLSDNQCWMIENLRLADTHQEGANTVPTTLTTANTNNPLNDGTNVTLKLNYSDSAIATHLSPTSNVAYNADTAPGGWCNTDSAACDDQSRLRTDNTANRATYTTTTNMTSHSANLYSYGNYYNWYSATAGNGTYSKSSGNTAGDLCPAGWHLPTGHSTSAAASGEFGLLSNSLGGYKNASDVAQSMSSSTAPTAAIMDKRLRHFPNNFLRSGVVNGASLDNRGSVGYYWSSTAGSNNNAYNLYFYSSSVYPGASSSRKYSGRTVRCLVSPGA